MKILIFNINIIAMATTLAVVEPWIGPLLSYSYFFSKWRTVCVLVVFAYSIVSILSVKDVVSTKRRILSLITIAFLILWMSGQGYSWVISDYLRIYFIDACQHPSQSRSQSQSMSPGLSRSDEIVTCDYFRSEDGFVETMLIRDASDQIKSDIDNDTRIADRLGMPGANLSFEVIRVKRSFYRIFIKN